MKNDPRGLFASLLPPKTAPSECYGESLTAIRSIITVNTGQIYYHHLSVPCNVAIISEMDQRNLSYL